MVKPVFVTEDEVKAIVDKMYDGDYIEPYIEPNIPLLTATEPVEPNTLDNKLKILLPVIDTAAQKEMKDAGFDRPRVNFAVFAYAYETDLDVTRTVTVSARIKLPNGEVLKEKQKLIFDERFKDALVDFVHGFELTLLHKIISIHNINVLNFIVEQIEEANPDVPFKIGFDYKDVPIVSINKDKVVFGVSDYKAEVVTPSSDFASVLELIEDTEEDTEEVIDISTDTVLEDADVEEELATEDLVNTLVPKLTEEEEVKEETETPEERQLRAKQEYIELIKLQKAESFLDGLMNVWLASATPLEFIHNYYAPFFEVVAGNVTKNRANKVLPLLKDSFYKTKGVLDRRKQGTALIIEDDVATIYDKDLETGEISEVSFDVETLSFKD